MAFSDFFKKGGKNSANAAKIGKTAQERKDISIEILKSQGVPYIDHLPLRYETSENHSARKGRGHRPRDLLVRGDNVRLLDQKRRGQARG